MHEKMSMNDKTLSRFQHPCVFPVLDLDFSQEQEQIVTVYPYTSEGSLKDVIYKVIFWVVGEHHFYW